jgi:hypothetical protein
MNAIERRQYDMLVRVRDFGDNHGHLFPASSVARQNFEAVAAAIKELDAQAVTHMAASLSARAERKTKARDTLLARLHAISQTARVLPVGELGLDQQFKVPSPATDHMLLTAGRKFAGDAEAFSSQFVAHGMPATFLGDLNALVDGFEGALRDRGLGRDARRAARASTTAALSAGLAAVRSLDVIVINHLRDDVAATSVWERERRIVYPPHAKRTDATAAPAAAGAAPDAPTGTKAA